MQLQGVIAAAALAYKLGQPVTLYGYVRCKRRQSLQHGEEEQHQEKRAALQVEGLPQLHSPPHHQACRRKGSHAQFLALSVNNVNRPVTKART